LTYKPIDSVFS